MQMKLKDLINPHLINQTILQVIEPVILQMKYLVLYQLIILGLLFLVSGIRYSMYQWRGNDAQH